MSAPHRSVPRRDDGWAIAVDVGGTFTDVTLGDPAGRRWTSVKTATTPDDPSAGFARGIELALSAAGVDAADVGRVLHGTTIATNAVLEGTGARAGLITTAGFRHVLEIGRHDGPRRTSLLHWTKPARPIPPDRIVEVDERVSHEGTVLRPLDEAGVRSAAHRLRAAGVESVAVSLINAYANDVHERRVAAILASALPGVPVSRSSAIHPVFREYERTMVTALNAYVVPLMADYLARLEGRLADLGIRAPVLVIQSNGGFEAARDVAARPAWTILSGPAAGVVGAVEVARSARCEPVISLDVGGTSSDVAVVRRGRPDLTDEGSVGPWPLALPMIDLHTVGAGGGSLAWLGTDGDLRVGPASAGARPGPACYGLGGEHPTVTDAQLVLGRVPDRLAGGAVALDRDAALAAIRRDLAEPLGLDPLEVACGIVELADDSIAAAIRVVSTERGRDPRDHVLVAGGGAGPLHAAGVAALLGVTRIVVSARPGVLSTLGLLAGGLRRDFVRTVVARLDPVAAAAVGRAFRALDRDADRWFEAASVPAEGRSRRRLVALRYPEQPTELLVPWPEGQGQPGEAVASAFRDAHTERYGYALPDSPVEVVAVRLEASAAGPALPPLEVAAPAPPPPGDAGGAARRPVFVDRERGLVDVPVLVRASFASGQRVAGPAVVEQPDATLWLPPGWTGRADDVGNLVLEREVAP